MSADNYAVCPQCSIDHQIELNRYQHIVDNQYGVVSQEEYKYAQQFVREHGINALEHNLRETWEIGMWKGKFIVNYYGGCNQCGYSYEYEYEDDVMAKLVNESD